MSDTLVRQKALFIGIALLGLCCSTNADKGFEGKSNPVSPISTPKETKLSAIQVSEPEINIWEGKSGGLHLRWTTAGLHVKNQTDTKEILRPLVEKGFADFASVYTSDKRGRRWRIEDCTYERNIKLLSVLGTLVSFEDGYFDYCGGAHPSEDTRFTTVDLAGVGDISYVRQRDTPMMNVDLGNPGRIVKLTDYFSHQEILHAILADPVMKTAISDLRLPKAPRKLDDLPTLFASSSYELGNSGFELRPDFLTRFAFHHVEGNKVAVRLGLPPHYGANRTQHMQIGLLLPIPESLRQPVALAAPRREGFLMRDEAEIAKGKATKFRFGTARD